MNTKTSNINCEDFWRQFKKKHMDYEPLELSGPLQTHDFYSSSIIPREVVRDILIKAARKLKVADKKINADSLSIHIVHNKYLELEIQTNFKQPTLLRTYLQIDSQPLFQTKIVLKTSETFLSTRIAVEFMKLLQNKFNDCVFKYGTMTDVWGEEIQAINFEREIFDDPVAENLFNEMGVSIHLPDEKNY